MIKLYISPTCPFCDKARDFLKKNNIEFQEVDVKDNREQAEKIVRKAGKMLVPIIEIDGKFILGFDEKELKKALNV